MVFYPIFHVYFQIGKASSKSKAEYKQKTHGTKLINSQKVSNVSQTII